MTGLADRSCRPVAPGTPPLDRPAIASLLGHVPLWRLSTEGDAIERVFRFPDYARTLDFVNAVAALAEQQDHHPLLEVGYGHCTVRFSTHAARGLTENDFICGARIDRLAAAL